MTSTAHQASGPADFNNAKADMAGNENANSDRKQVHDLDLSVSAELVPVPEAGANALHQPLDGGAEFASQGAESADSRSISMIHSAARHEESWKSGQCTAGATDSISASLPGGIMTNGNTETNLQVDGVHGRALSGAVLL